MAGLRDAAAAGSATMAGLRGAAAGSATMAGLRGATMAGLRDAAAIAESIEAAVAGGVTMIQLREKHACTREFYEMALAARKLTKRLGVPLVINDRADIALASDADGLHIGQSDIPLAAARALLGKGRFIGVSAGTLKEALDAQRGGADYLGVGAVYPTGSKDDAGEAIGLAGLGAIRAAVDIPIVGIGGIGAANAAYAIEAGADGIAVISAILSQPDIRRAARALRDIVERARNIIA
jgi:thiamine-phosphate pyrophosphorylase